MKSLDLIVFMSFQRRIDRLKKRGNLQIVISINGELLDVTEQTLWQNRPAGLP